MKEPCARYPGLDLLRVVAIALIVNSHLDGLYPVPALATGGAIGNALFFALSGFGLAASSRKTGQGFFAWYRRRVCRIYPALVPAVALFVAVPARAWGDWGLREWAAQVLWPTSYWFVGALMLFYVLVYPLLRIARPAAYAGAILALLIPYLAWYLTALDLSRYTIEGAGYFKWIHYLQIMIFGACLGSWRERLAGGSGWRDGVLLAAVVAGYHALLLLVVDGRAAGWQGLSHLLVYPLVLFAFRLACSPAIGSTVLGPGWVRGAVGFVAAMTLELYLVQGTVRALPVVQASSFPSNVVLCLLLTLAAAHLLHRAAAAVARLVRCPS